VVLDISKLGSRYGPDAAVVDADRAVAYAAATGGNGQVAPTGLVPPLFAVVPTWDTTMSAVHDIVPADSMGMLVHLDQDMRFVRPLGIGLHLSTEAVVEGIRARRSGAQLLVVVTSIDDTGAVVLRQYATMFIRGLGGGESGGDDPPGHGFPPGARSRPLATRTNHIDADQTLRYAEASGDTNAIHLDDEFARSMGLPGIIVHGMCTMALSTGAVLDEAGGGDPSLLRRAAVRFSRPVLPGSDLVTTIFDAGTEGDRRLVAFEAHSGGQVVVKDGWAEIGPPEA